MTLWTLLLAVTSIATIVVSAQEGLEHGLVGVLIGLALGIAVAALWLMVLSQGRAALVNRLGANESYSAAAMVGAVYLLVPAAWFLAAQAVVSTTRSAIALVGW